MTRATPELIARLAELLAEAQELVLELRRRHGEDSPQCGQSDEDGADE